jgi:hypothetical protein
MKKKPRRKNPHAVALGRLGGFGAERGQKAREQRARVEKRPGQEPQEDHCRAPQFPPSAARTHQENLIALVALIRARFGAFAIGIGNGGIRSPASMPR